jgi:NAD(P)-dependent dehydrogenase (short-subunit alcohol dehydrogenase family)
MRILITGAARAIGAATARALSARDHEVVATGRDRAALEGVDAAIKLTMDVCDPDSIATALRQAGDLDAVVNNAAISTSGPLEDFPIPRLHELFDTNCFGALRMVQALAPAWRERGTGVFVNVSSVQGRVATPLGGAYAATKYALEALSEVLHYELSHFGIRTVIVQPGFTAPGMKPSPPHTGPPAYRDLWDQWSGIDDKVTGIGGRPGPELVATAIADAIEDPTTPLRVRVGQDTELIFSVRHELNDADFESAMRATLGITW